jgi:hypothetical protein
MMYLPHASNVPRHSRVFLLQTKHQLLHNEILILAWNKNKMISVEFRLMNHLMKSLKKHIYYLL